MRLRNDVVEAPIRRRVDVVAWCFVTIGVIALIAPLVRIAVFDRTAGFDLLILAIPIAVGIRAGRDGWRIAALGAAFLCACVSVMTILLLVGNGGYITPGRSQDVAWGALAALGTAIAAGGWVAWLLTRPLCCGCSATPDHDSLAPSGGAAPRRPRRTVR